MSRNIVLLSDGTGNSAAKLHKTNVWRLYRALNLTTDKQVAQYDDGVGTSSFRPLALLGSACGFGLARNVRHLYAFLSRNYKENGNDKDKVFAFGFSRGAYTIRVLIGLVDNQGLVDSELHEKAFQSEVLSRWNAYRSERFPLWGPPAKGTPDEIGKERRRVPKFEFVGLWDTVGAYGLPFEELQGLIPIARLRDRKLSRFVECAYHALSLDDERRSFHPILWDESKPEDRARIQQVWFPGVHSNIGGGYPKDGLAYVSLEWMVDKAKSLGLDFLEDHVKEIRQQANPHGQFYDSRAGFGGYYRYSPRPVTTLGKDAVNNVTIERPKVHVSAFMRIRGGRVAYGPIGVPLVYDLVLKEGNVVPGPCDAVKDEKGDTKIVATKYESKPASEFLENPDRAQLRATQMEVAWNVVWWRRIFYFLTLISSLYLVALPALPKHVTTWQVLPVWTAESARYLKPILKVAGYLVPDWVGKTWLGRFGEEPLLFLIGLVCVAVTMAIGLWLEKTIHSRAEDIWHPKSEVPKWAEKPKSTWLYKLRSCRRVIELYQWYRVIARIVTPVIVVVACVVAGVWFWRQYAGYIVAYAILIAIALVGYWVWQHPPSTSGHAGAKKKMS